MIIRLLVLHMEATTLGASLHAIAVAYQPLTREDKFKMQYTQIKDELHARAAAGDFEGTYMVNTTSLYYYDGLENELANHLRARDVVVRRTTTYTKPPVYWLDCTW